MSTVNAYFSHGTRNEQYLVEDLIIESLKIFGNEMMYIPRQLISKDDILGEDRLSEFKNSYPIEMYFENVDSFDGQGMFMSKFGLMIEQSATLVVSRRRWDQMIGRYGASILPNRPAEGDLIYFPLTGGLFEIKFVKHQDPFYQLGKLYVYKLHVELFQYASERLDTSIASINVFESLKTFDSDSQKSIFGMIESIKLDNRGENYTSAEVNILSNTGVGAMAEAVLSNGEVVAINVLNHGRGYRDAIVHIVGDGTGAFATPIISIDIDKVESYGDNNSFKKEAQNIVFDSNNPFGEVDP